MESSAGSTPPFWFAQGDTPGWQTEIDVFELCGKSRHFERKYNMTLHVRHICWHQHVAPSVGDHRKAPWRTGRRLTPPTASTGARAEPKFYVDGVLVGARVENTHWHQPLLLIFDSEAMPEWFGMPADLSLFPSTPAPYSTLNVDGNLSLSSGMPNHSGMVSRSKINNSGWCQCVFSTLCAPGRRRRRTSAPPLPQSKP